MPLLKQMARFGGREVIGDLSEGCISGTMVGTPDWSGLESVGGRKQPALSSVAMREGQP